MAFLLEGLNLGDYVAPFKAAGITGGILVHCASKESLAEEGVHMTTARFGVLRAAVEEFSPSGVPTSLLDEAQGRVQQREQEAADAALAHRLHQEQQQRLHQEQQQQRLQQEQQQRIHQEQQQREAAARRKAEAPQKVITNHLCRHHHNYHHQRFAQNLTISHYFHHQCVSH